MAMRLPLAHLHLPYRIAYQHALTLQEAILSRHFAYNTAQRLSASHDSSTATTTTTSTSACPPTQPRPTLLTFQTHPTYTVGRRHLNTSPLSTSEISFLTSNSSTTSSISSSSCPKQSSFPSTTATTIPSNAENQLASFHPSPRGGLLTYHAPGQLTSFLILNLRTHKLTPRCYIRMLENAVIRTCAKLGLYGCTVTRDPGVWVTERITETRTGEMTGVAEGKEAREARRVTDRKICAVGVHVSRGVTSHGIGLNVVDTEIDRERVGEYTVRRGSQYLRQRKTVPRRDEPGDEANADVAAPGYLSWGFDRITACGLEGKTVTWLDAELDRLASSKGQKMNGPGAVTVDVAAQVFAREIAESLEIGQIDKITEDMVLGSDSPV